MNDAAVLILVAAIPALGAYIAASRRMSGSIKSTEAQTLWEQSSRMFDAQAKRMVDLEKRVADLERDNNALSRDNLGLREENLRLERELAQLKERCDALARENQYLKETLRNKLGGLDA